VNLPGEQEGVNHSSPQRKSCGTPQGGTKPHGFSKRSGVKKERPPEGGICPAAKEWGKC